MIEFVQNCLTGDCKCNFKGGQWSLHSSNQIKSNIIYSANLKMKNIC